MHLILRAWGIGNQPDRKASLLTNSDHGYVRRSIFDQALLDLSFSPKTGSERY